MRHLGTGAASELYAVHDPKTRQIWALKHVVKKTDRDQRFLEQVEVEYDVASHLEHPSIRHVHKIIRHRKRFKTFAVSLVMELVDAVSLDNKIPSNTLDAISVFAHVAEALAHMHGRGYVHADIKPSNILVSDTTDVKVIDLGQACKIGTVKERIQGTPGYMAPEQAHREPIVPQTDIYNLGATMYWVLTGEVIPTSLPPKDSTSSIYSGAVESERIELPPPPHVKNPDVHELLSKQIMDCIQVEPTDRPESMQVVLNRLQLLGNLLEQSDTNLNTIAAELENDDTAFGGSHDIPLSES